MFECPSHSWTLAMFREGSPLHPSYGAGHATVAGACVTILKGELNKLASNVAIGRNLVGVHWRSDYTESLKLGETVAIGVLRDQTLTYGEEFDGYTFTRFDGSKITV